MRHLQTLILIDAVVRAGSIRKAAVDMNITASALNRRVQAFEEEFGAQVFERLPNGMRLNPAGELLIQHIRRQMADLAVVRSQVADLSGVRRGRVGVACSQALLPYFLPREVSRYRAEHAGVQFSVKARARDHVESCLENFDADIAVVFEPSSGTNVEYLHAIVQQVNAVMASDHPLAQVNDLRLRDCLNWPLVVPNPGNAVRTLLEAGRSWSRETHVIVETNSYEFARYYVQTEQAIAFQLPIGVPENSPGVVARTLPERDLPAGELAVGRLHGRSIPVASAKFAQHLIGALEAHSLPLIK